jgi:four helix bundle protein
MVYASYEEFPIWKESVAFAADVIKLCRIGELEHEYRLRGQLVSAAVSISSNIAEGFEYNNNRQFSRYLFYAKGSASEVHTQLNILFSAGMIDMDAHKTFSSRSRDLSRKIGGLIQYLARSGHPGFRFPTNERELR